ncbi:hypothetical protein ScPMuIL_009864 [Solemya velum]
MECARSRPRLLASERPRSQQRPRADSPSGSSGVNNMSNELTLMDDSEKMVYTLLVSESIMERIRRDTVVSDMLFKCLVELHPIQEADHETLSPIASVEVLSHIGLLGELSKQAQGASVTKGIGAKFDDSAVTAYSKELGDRDLQRLSAAAPKHFSPSEKLLQCPPSHQKYPEKNSSALLHPRYPLQIDLFGAMRLFCCSWICNRILTDCSPVAPSNRIRHEGKWQKLCHKKDIYASLTNATGSLGEWKGVAPVASLLNVDEQPNDPSQSEDTGRANEIEAETTCTPNMTPQRKRKRPNDIEPAWVADFRADLKSMHEEKMQIDKDWLDLEARRVNSFKCLVKLLENKSD